jgi:hypothetical protein
MSRRRGLVLKEEGESSRVGSGPLSCAEIRVRKYYKSMPERHKTQQSKIVVRTLRHAVML